MGSQLEVAAEKGFGGFQHLASNRTAAEAEALIGKQMHLHRYALGLQGKGHALGLGRRHHLVIEALEEDYGAVDLPGMGQG